MSPVLKALDGGRIRPFDQAAADLSPWSSYVWFRPGGLTVEAAHWLIDYMPFVLVLEIIVKFEFGSTAILRVTPRLTTHSFVTTHHCNKEFQL